MTTRICHICTHEVAGDDYACPACGAVVLGGTVLHQAKAEKTCGQCHQPLSADDPLTLCTRCALGGPVDLSGVPLKLKVKSWVAGCVGCRRGQGYGYVAYTQGLDYAWTARGWKAWTVVRHPVRALLASWRLRHFK